MSYINTAETGSFVEVQISTTNDFTVAGNDANILTIPALQEVTINATPGIFRWKTLDSLSEYALTTSSTNSISTTMVLDDAAFFTGAGTTDGILDLVNNKTPIYFRVYWQGSGATTDRYVGGQGYLSGLASTVSPDSPVWTTPLTIEVVGDMTPGLWASGDHVPA